MANGGKNHDELIEKLVAVNRVAKVVTEKIKELEVI